MRKIFAPFVSLFLFSILLNGIKVYAQQPVAHVKNMLNAGVKNYTTFTAPNTNNKQEALAHNPGYENHPEVGELFAEAPCDNCYELIGKRTEQSKLFVKNGTNGKDVMQQTSSGAMHYRGANGEWLTVKSQLKPQDNKPGTFAALEQEAPVVISPANKFCTLGKEGQQFKFNNNLELLTDGLYGPVTSLGKADYSHYTAGDDGVYITDVWPGIDMEIFVVRGAIKTNFIIKHPLQMMSGDSSGLIIRDNVHLASGLSITYDGTENNIGNWEIRNIKGDGLYAISGVTAYEQANAKNTMQHLQCLYTDQGQMDILIPNQMLLRPASSYPLVIDPLVTLATASAVNGSTYSSGFTTGCIYNNPATVPANVTVTDVQFTFQYITGGGAVLNNGAYDFKLGTCRSPSVPTLFWNCNSLLTGTCDAILATIYPQLSTCIPAPQCSSYNMNLTMDFYQDYNFTTACSPSYIMAGTPLTITISGHTVESNPVIATGGSTICAGGSTTLTASSLYGVGPYTYTWYPGGSIGASFTASPASTTTYTVVSQDACGNTSSATETVNVNLVSPISGVTTVCVGGTTPLSCTPAGGTWTSTNTAIATVGSSSGIVSGVAVGTATIKYTTSAGCVTSTPITVKAAVAPITGSPVVCQGSTTSLSDPTPSGTWSSGATSIAIIGSSTGFASGISGGTAIISYSTFGGGCYATMPLTVNPISAITGSLSFCLGGSTTLSDAVAGGTWSSTSALVSVGSATGIVSGLSVGSASVTYTTAAGCIATTTVVINFMSAISGAASVCQGNTTTLSNSTSGGTWTSTNTGVATIGSTGIVTGISGGTSLISYSIPGGCFTTKTVTVNPISPIAGTPGVCVGGTTTLVDASGPGTWTSGSTGVASVGSASGIVTGVTVGSALVTFTTAAGCSASTAVSITLPTPTSGSTSVCQGSTTTLSNPTTGGTWTSSNPAIATAGAGTGTITGLNSGTVIITYTTPAGCAVTTPVTVNANPPVTGTTLLCTGNTTTLSSISTGGSWASGAAGIASVDAVTGIVSGVAAGMAGITYTTVAGCVNATTVTVNAPSPISGTPNVCQGSSMTLTDAVPGGTWSSSNPAVASVGVSSGTVTGMTGGAVTISYASAGGCNATTSFTVNPLSLITGGTSVCAGGSIPLGDATPGGTWSSGSTALATVDATTGIVTGVSGGTVAINYTTPAGCIASTLINVAPAPAPISGSTLVCSSGLLSDAVPGGSWSSSNPTIASIGISSGAVTGINPGIVTITYSLAGGCITTTTLTVDPVTPISGGPNVCQGSTTALSYPQPGGTWSSFNPAIATVDASGVVTGVSAGVTTIKYTTTTGCIASINVTVYPILPVTGPSTVCQGSSITLSDATPGGSWASSNPGVAPVGASTGSVSGSAAGTSVITYTTSAGCTATTTITVNATAPVTGTPAVCIGDMTTLSNGIAGGSWSSLNPAIASIDPVSGAASGVAAGTTTIKYTTSAGCVSNFSFTVNAVPSAISGSPTVCQGQTILLSNTLAGGAWTSSIPSVATIGVASGIVTGINTGTTVISYTTLAGCFAYMNVTVNPLLATSGVGAICVGSTTTLANTTPGGGVWSSTSTGVATVDLISGLVTGVSAGTAGIKFTTVLGCVTTVNEVINPLPSAIGGITSVCVGSTTTLINTLSGGSWSVSNPGVATIGVSSGVVTGMSADTVTVTYSSSAGCTAFIVVTVNPLPAAITGTTSICAGATTTLNDATVGGTWSSLAPGIASVGPTSGIVTGVSAGVTTVNYTTPQGCASSIPFTVNPMPGAITGTVVVCAGSTTTLHNTLGGGSWTSSQPSVASIGAGTGTMTGVTAGIATITYSTTAGCLVVRNVTVNPTPAISGISSTNPTTCINHDGTITLSGLVPGASYTVNYSSGSIPVSIVLTADGSGKITITGLPATIYTNFTVTTTLGCTSNTIPGPVVLSLPAPPPVPVAGNSSPICNGVSLQLIATDATPGVTYSWSGPAGFASTLQNPVLNPTTMTEAGTYSVTATALSCVSAPATTTVVIHPIPEITSVISTNPTTCLGTDGTITLKGLDAGVTYITNYSFGGQAFTVTLVADASGNITITGLSAGTYSGFNVSSFTCLSNSAGPVTLKDPNPPAAPKLSSNSPLCSGKTLQLNITNAINGLMYDWSGPNGFSSDISDPEIPNVTLDDSGTYTLTVKYLNCPATASTYVTVYPPVVLKNVTPGQTIPLGSYIKLNAEGAEFYLWYTNDGSLSDPNIATPIATPQQTTEYLVTGMNQWGCEDSAKVPIVVDDHAVEGVPGAFTPNGDGLNDVFKVANMKYDKLVDFSVYNRWGQLIYHNTYDANQGWDGTFNGVAQDMGTYNYSIILSNPDGKMKYYKGSVELIR